MRPNKYDWNEWFRKRRFTLRCGVHYRVSQSTMVQTIRGNASRLGYSVSIRDEGDKVVVTVRGRKAVQRAQ